jgi:hypothetical protein
MPAFPADSFPEDPAGDGEAQGRETAEKEGEYHEKDGPVKQMSWKDRQICGGGRGADC